MFSTMRDKKAIRLGRLKLFDTADSKALKHLATAAEEVSVPTGKVLIKQGVHHHEVFVVESGEASVDIDGRQVAVIGEENFVGELAFLHGQPASATVTARTEMRLLVLPYPHLNAVLNENPDLVRKIANELARRLDATNALLHR